MCMMNSSYNLYNVCVLMKTKLDTAWNIFNKHLKYGTVLCSEQFDIISLNSSSRCAYKTSP